MDVHPVDGARPASATASSALGLTMHAGAPVLVTGQRALSTAIRRLRVLPVPVPVEVPAWAPVMGPRTLPATGVQGVAIEIAGPVPQDRVAAPAPEPASAAAAAAQPAAAVPAAAEPAAQPAVAGVAEPAAAAEPTATGATSWEGLDATVPLAIVIADRAAAAHKRWLSEPVQSLAVERARSTPAQRIGDDGERLAAIHLDSLGWQVLARNLRLSRAEVDLLAIDPSDPPSLVVVEVRRRNRRDYGLPEETIDYRKRCALLRAVGELASRRGLPDGRRLPELPVRVDLIAIDRGPDGQPSLRHHRGIDI